MKKILSISIAVMMAGCGGSGGDPDGITATHSNVVTQQERGTSANGSNTAVQTASDFLMNAFEQSVQEIAVSELALERATNDNVRRFAQRLIADHTQKNNEIRQLAEANNINLPANAMNAGDAGGLESLNGTAFDRAYMQHNVQVHEASVAQSRAQAASASNVDIKIFARNSLPALQTHLLAAKAISGTIDSAVFLRNAYQDGQAEIRLSTLAVEKASNASVREFAQMMIEDHTRANNEIAQLVQGENITLPTAVTPQQRAIYEELATLSGADFDKAYMNHNVLVHGADVVQASAQAQGGQDAEISAYAVRLEPALVTHLETAVDLYKAIEPSLLFMAYQDGQGEILLSKLALQKSSNQQVHQFAQRMITDHSATNSESEQLADTRNLTLPSEVSPAQVSDYIRLSQLSDAEFDQAYMQRNIQVHERDVQHFQEHAANETDAGIREFAAATLSLLTSHLEQARQISSSLAPATEGSQQSQ